MTLTIQETLADFPGTNNQLAFPRPFPGGFHI